jgi:hypothetical protein
LKSSPSHVIGASFALAAFSVAVVAGLAAGNGASEILVKGILVMGACYPCGYFVGIICNRVISEHLNLRAIQSQAMAAGGQGVEKLEDEGIDSELETPIVV